MLVLCYMRMQALPGHCACYAWYLVARPVSTPLPFGPCVRGLDPSVLAGGALSVGAVHSFIHLGIGEDHFLQKLCAPLFVVLDIDPHNGLPHA